MKKILSLLTAITLTASATTSVISCSSKSPSKTSNIGPIKTSNIGPIDTASRITPANTKTSTITPAKTSIKASEITPAKTKSKTSQDIINALEGQKINIDNKYNNTSTNNNDTKNAIINSIISNGLLNKDDTQYLSFGSKTLSLKSNYISVTANKDGKTASTPSTQAKELNVYVNQPLSQNHKLVGYWTPWEWAEGVTHVTLNETLDNTNYNVIDIPFFNSTTPGKLPTLDLARYGNNVVADAKSGIIKAHKQHKLVIMSMGGQDSSIALSSDQEAAFKKDVEDTIAKWNLDGIDIDFEGSVVNAGHNNSIVPKVLKEIRSEWNAKGKHFYITMAAESANLMVPGAGGPGNTSTYKAYFENFGNDYDWVQTQLYNQGSSNGALNLDADDKNQDPDFKNLPDRISHKTPNSAGIFDFLFSKKLDNGTAENKWQGKYLQIPANKIVLGMGVGPNSAGSGWSKPQELINAYKYFKKYNLNIKGIMGWTANFDKENFNWGFNNAYTQTWGTA